MLLSTQAGEVRQLFGAIAQKYDTVNALLSLGLHFGWNRVLCRAISEKKPTSLLDLCAGTGAISLRLGKKLPSLKQITLLDFSSQMLSIAAQKRALAAENISASVDFLEADACQLPVALKNGQFDAVCMAYGVRNVDSPEAVFRGVWQALRPGGTLGILELTRPENPALLTLHRAYLKLLPAVGCCFTGQKRAYSHLSRSVGQFVEMRALANLARKICFEVICTRPLCFGIATLLVCRKRGESP